jgi:hypothetical protein
MTSRKKTNASKATRIHEKTPQKKKQQENISMRALHNRDTICPKAHISREASST